MAAALLLLTAACDDAPAGRPALSKRAQAMAPAVPAAPVVAPDRADAAARGLPALRGDWKVVGVRVAPGPVQALEENDPSDMGAVLHIGEGRLWWDAPAQGSFPDSCDAPILNADGTIRCANGMFGPPGAKLVAANDGRLTLDWYDGAILDLTRR